MPPTTLNLHRHEPYLANGGILLPTFKAYRKEKNLPFFGLTVVSASRLMKRDFPSCQNNEEWKRKIYNLMTSRIEVLPIATIVSLQLVNTGCSKKRTKKQTKMAKHVMLVNVPNWSKGVQRVWNGQPRCFLTISVPFGPIWTLSDHFKQKWFLLKSAFAKPYFVLMRQQIDVFFLKWSKSVQMGPKGSQIVKNI